MDTVERSKLRALATAITAALAMGLLLAAAPAEATPPCCAPVPPGLVSWWPGNGSPADVVSHFDGVLQGGAGYATGKVGQGFTFDSVDDYVSVPDNAQLHPGTGSFTVDAWIKTSGPEPSSGQQVIRHYECAGFCTDAASSSDWDLRVSGHKLLGFVRDTDKGGPVSEGEGQNIQGATTIDDGVFHHVALVRDVTAGKLRLYVDGSLDAEQDLNAGASGSISNIDGDADPVTIGGGILGGTSNPDPNVVFTGVIDEPDWFLSALTGPQIAAIAAAGSNGKCTDEIAPTSSATAPATSGGPIAVNWTASDTGGSGLTRVALWVRAPGQSGFTEVAVSSGAATSGMFTYTPSAGNGDYAFYTLAEDANCGREAAPAAPQAVTTVNIPSALTPTPTFTPATTPSADVAAAAATPACLSIPAVIRNQAAPVRGGGRVLLLTKQIDDPAHPLQATVRFAGRGKIRTVTFSSNGRILAAAAGRLTVAVPIGALRIGRGRNGLTAKVTTADGRRATVTQFFVVQRCPLPAVSCQRLGDGRSLRCTGGTPLRARKVKVVVTRSARETAVGTAAVTRGRYTVVVRSSASLAAGRYAYKYVATTRQRGQQFQVLRIVNVS
jgi:hypothetical protein